MERSKIHQNRHNERQRTTAYIPKTSALHFELIETSLREIKFLRKFHRKNLEFF